MTRIEFTENLGKLILAAKEKGYDIVLGWVLRDDETQRRLFNAGLSGCNGTTKISAHQIGKAADIYIIEDKKISNDKDKYDDLHQIWSGFGGKPMIKLKSGWDMGHFEG